MTRKLSGFLCLLLLMFISMSLFSQSPEKFSFQAVIRDSNNKLITNSNVGIKISILKASTTGTSVYTETHSAQTNINGLISIEIGEGNVISGSFNTINWSTAPYFLKTETDPKGGGNYSIVSVTQLLSVPYALHSKTADIAINDNDIDSSNEIQVLSISNDTLFLQKGGFVVLPKGFDGKYTSLSGVPTKLSEFGNDVGYISSLTNFDGDTTNEIQYLTRNGNFIELTKANKVSINDADSLPTNEIQNLKKIGNVIYLSSNGGSVSDDDNQNLTSSSSGTQRIINISGGTGTTIDIRDLDSDSTNEIQSLVITGDSIGLSKNNSRLKLPSKWSLTGDSGTIDGTHFIGTTDSVALNFRVNNEKAGKIDFVKGNTFIGYQSGNSINTGTNNVGIGYQALYKPLSSVARHNNTAIGYQALYSQISVTSSVGVGYKSLYSSTTGNTNACLGTETMYSSTTGSWSVAIGHQTLYSNTTGSMNTSVGYQSMYSSTTGDFNAAFGYHSLKSNTSGSNNTALGHQAMFSNTVGQVNVGVGLQALYSNTTAFHNIGMGWRAMYNTSTGEKNITIGSQSLYSNTVGNRNIVIGHDALYFSTGNSNIAIGFHAAKNTYLGSRNIIIGDSIMFPNPAGSYQLNIGNIIYAVNANGIGTTISTGNVGIKENNPSSALEVKGSFGGEITTTNSSITLDASHYTLIVTGGTPTITLPSTSTAKRRIYIIVNRTSSAISISAYNAINGSSLNTIPANSKITVQCDGSAWYQID